MNRPVGRSGLRPRDPAHIPSVKKTTRWWLETTEGKCGQRSSLEPIVVAGAELTVTRDPLPASSPKFTASHAAQLNLKAKVVGE